MMQWWSHLVSGRIRVRVRVRVWVWVLVRVRARVRVSVRAVVARVEGLLLGDHLPVLVLLQRKRLQDS